MACVNKVETVAMPIKENLCFLDHLMSVSPLEHMRYNLASHNLMQITISYLASEESYHFFWFLKKVFVLWSIACNRSAHHIHIAVPYILCPGLSSPALQEGIPGA